MTKYPYERRHSRWYELLLLNSLLHFICAYTFIVLAPFLLRWQSITAPASSTVAYNSLIASSAAFIIIFLILYKLKNLPSTHLLPSIIPTIILVWLGVLATFFFLREASYSRSVLLSSFLLTYAWAFLAFFFIRRYGVSKLALVPFGRANELLELETSTRICPLQEPDLQGRRYDGVVADLHAKDLPVDWQRFLANCTLAGIPVYHTQQAYETLTGRVKVEHLSENIFGALLPSRIYSLVKRIIDILLALITLPIWLPITLLAGIIIKFESEGPMFFIQKRVGQGNKDFNVYKLRSMCCDSEKNGAQFAQSNDMRITRVGKFIRKTRIDELPQFINILKGDMSLIGPRPEQRAFVDQFTKDIPFYSYRHVVKPGITGWAQVTQGYAADTDDTRIKIQYDFYYIKHFSLWLDLVVTIRTIYTIFTGFGAR